jgi:hypothetical protein
LLDLLKFIGGPGFLVFILLVLFGGTLLLYVWPRTRRFAKRWLLWVSGVYVVLGLPAVANTIVGALPPVDASRDRLDDVRTLLVLDGDNRRGRLEETVRFLRAHAPERFWVLGEEWLIEGLIRAGYPRHTFGHETQSRTTLEQMAWVASFVSGHSEARPVAVLASRVQMPRVAALARAAGVDVVLVPSPLDAAPATGGWRLFVPSYAALRASRDAICEHVALRYDRRQGWIANPR